MPESIGHIESLILSETHDSLGHSVCCVTLITRSDRPCQNLLYGQLVWQAVHRWLNSFSTATSDASDAHRAPITAGDLPGVLAEVERLLSPASQDPAPEVDSDDGLQ